MIAPAPAYVYQLLAIACFPCECGDRVRGYTRNMPPPITMLSVNSPLFISSIVVAILVMLKSAAIEEALRCVAAIPISSFM